MTFRIATTAQRAALLLFALLCFAFLAFFGLRSALADYFRGEDTQFGYEFATRLEPGSAENWYTLGRYWQYNLENPDSTRALAAYRTSLSIDPHSADAWLDFATLLESEGNVGQARSAFLKAKDAYPMSAEVAWRYGNFLLRQNDTDAAFAEFRNAVSIDPKRGAEAFSRCLRIEPDVAKVLDRAIPPSRSVYMDIIQTLVSLNQIDDALFVLHRLPASAVPVQLREFAQLVEALRRQKRLDEARSLWLQAAELAGLSGVQSPGSAVWDGGFESDISNFGFAWQYPGFSQGVQIVRDSAEKHSGRFSLRLSFNGQSNLYFHNVCQLVLVNPKTPYTLTAWTHTRGLTTDEGVHIELHAVSQVSPAVEFTSGPLGNQPWSQLEFAWSSPPDAQEASVCLVRDPSASADNRIRGEFWIDDIALRPSVTSSSVPKP